MDGGKSLEFSEFIFSGKEGGVDKFKGRLSANGVMNEGEEKTGFWVKEKRVLAFWVVETRDPQKATDSD